MAKGGLEWIEVDGGHGGWLPDCLECLEYMAQPFLREACASVGIEHGKSTDQMLKETVEHYHLGGHRSH
jgi:hypothetical protein